MIYFTRISLVITHFPLSNVYQKNHDTFMVMGHVFGKRNNDIRSPKIRFSYLVNKAVVLAISLMAGSVAMVVLLLPTRGNADWAVRLYRRLSGRCIPIYGDSPPHPIYYLITFHLPVMYLVFKYNFHKVMYLLFKYISKYLCPSLLIGWRLMPFALPMMLA